MTAEHILNLALQEGAILSLEGDNLKCEMSSKGISEELTNLIRSGKADIVSFLKELEATRGSDFEFPEIQKKLSVDGDYPTSFAQENMWLISQRDNTSQHYIVPLAFTFEGSLDASKIKDACGHLMDKHEVLKTVYKQNGNALFQRILTNYELPFRHLNIDVSLSSDEVMHEQFKQCLSQLDFDLELSPPFFVFLLSDNNNRHGLLLVLHHIVADIDSVSLLSRDFLSFFHSGAETRNDGALQYKDYASTQREFLSGDTLARLESFWHEKLNGAPQCHSLPLDKRRPNVMNHRGGSFELRLPTHIHNAVKTAVKRLACTEFSFYETFFAILVHHYSSAENVVIASPVSGRFSKNTENMVGCFVNTVLFHHKFDSDESLLSLLKNNSQNIVSCLEHSVLPIEKVIGLLERDMSNTFNPYLQLGFQWLAENKDTSNSTSKDASLHFKPFSLEKNISKFELGLGVRSNDDSTVLSWEYSSDLFEREYIKNLAQSMVALVTSFVSEPNQKTSQLNLLSPEDKLFYENYCTSEAISSEKNLVTEFQLSAGKAPDAIAIQDDNEELTYAELDEKSNKLASYLIQHGVSESDRVAILFDVSASAFVSILAILKVGAAFVPLDAQWPESRVKYILDDSHVVKVITGLDEKHFIYSIAKYKCISFDKAIDVGHADMKGLSVECSAGLNASCYVYYTSGTTGNPKGVDVSHAGVLNLTKEIEAKHPLDSDSKVSQFFSVCFDAAVGEMAIAWCHGAPLVIVPKEARYSAPQLQQFVIENKITHSLLPPSMLAHLDPDADYHFKQVLVGGEAFPENLAKLWAGKYSIYNAYGPTEATIFCLSDRLLETGKLTIGKPILNYQIRVVSPTGKVMPRGAIGELWLSGPGVAKGYWGKPELTQEKFTPLKGESGVWYHTGDLVRVNFQNNVEYLGRIDRQVQINGHRVELQELETILEEHELVKEAVIVVNTTNEERKELVAFCVSNIGDNATQEALRTVLLKFLRTRLPNYMMPAKLFTLDSIPLNTNNKIDLPQLRQWIDKDLIHAGESLPLSDTELTLARIWAQELNIEPHDLQPQDSFFELGGHSLLATSVIVKIKNEFHKEVSLKQFFENSTLGSAAELLDNLKVNVDGSDNSAGSREMEHYSTSYFQRRMWFLDARSQRKGLYNIVNSFEVNGELCIESLNHAFGALCQKHKTLRTRYFLEKGQVRQSWEGVHPPSVTLFDFSTKSKQALQEAFHTLSHAEFDLEKGDVIRINVLKVNTSSFIIHVVVHHIAADGWSMEIIQRDLLSFYQSAMNGDGVSYEDIAYDYVDFASYEVNKLAQDKVGLKYWTDHLKDFPATDFLPTDFIRSAEHSHEGTLLNQHVDSGITRELRQIANKLNMSMFMLVEGVLALMLARWSDKQDIVLGTQTGSREIAGSEETVGGFLNEIVLRNKINRQHDLGTYLTHTRDMILNSMEHRHVPIDLITKELGLNNPDSESLFHVWFVYQNFKRQNLNFDRADADTALLNPSTAVTKFDLSLYVNEVNDALDITWIWDVNLFAKDTIEYAQAQLLEMLSSVSRSLLSPVDSLPGFGITYPSAGAEAVSLQDSEYLAKQFLEKIIKGLIQSEELSVVEDFSQTLTGTECLQLCKSFGETIKNRRGNVAILMKHGVFVVPAFLACLTHGKTCVPLDPMLPENRLKFIAEDADVGCIICDKHSLALANQICLNDETMNILCCDKSAIDHTIPVSSFQLSASQYPGYILYTSGSTGTPKGVLQSTSNLAWHIGTFVERADINQTDRVLQIASYQFDQGLMDMFGALFGGAKLYLLDIKGLPASQLREFIFAKQITFYHSTPTVFRHVFSEGDDTSSSIVKVVLGGEAVNSRDISLLKRKFDKKTLFVNGLGPTESTTAFQWRRRVEEVTELQRIPVGKPVPETAFVLKNADEEVRYFYQAGEIHLRSPYIANGYLNQDTLTREKFRSIGNGLVEYKMGDMGYLDHRGELVHVGRADAQVKFNGLRIELSEIERNLCHLANVSDAAVMLKDIGQKNTIVAFVDLVTSDETCDHHAEAEAIRSALTTSLPGYMIPGHIQIVSPFPYTPSVKVNRSVLNTIEIDIVDKMIPLSIEQDQVANIWCEVLQIEVEKIGASSNFFSLGGDSLKLIELVWRIREFYPECNFELKDVYLNPTICAMTDLVISNQSDSHELSGCLVNLNQNRSTAPLVLFHQIWGRVDGYASLAQGLEDVTSVIGVQAPYNIARSFDFTDLEQLVEYYADILVEELPASSYKLGGSSLGGNIAFLVAKALQKRGKEIKYLGIVDSYLESITEYEQLDDAGLLNLVISELIYNFTFDAHIVEKFEEIKLQSLPTAERLKKVAETLLLDTSYAAFSPETATGFISFIYNLYGCKRVYTPIDGVEYCDFLLAEDGKNKEEVHDAWRRNSGSMSQPKSIRGSHATLLVGPSLEDTLEHLTCSLLKLNN